MVSSPPSAISCEWFGCLPRLSLFQIRVNPCNRRFSPNFLISRFLPLLRFGFRSSNFRQAASVQLLGTEPLLERGRESMNIPLAHKIISEAEAHPFGFLKVRGHDLAHEVQLMAEAGLVKA